MTTELEQMKEQIIAVLNNKTTNTEEGEAVIHWRFFESIATDLTALISEKQAEYFEFAKWIGFESSRLYYRDLDEKWIRTIFIIDENPHEEYEEYTTDELFNYWEENEQ